MAKCTYQSNITLLSVGAPLGKIVGSLVESNIISLSVGAPLENIVGSLVETFVSKKYVTGAIIIIPNAMTQ